MAAFIFSILVTFAMLGVIAYVAWRRPQDQPMSWGEGMVGAVWIFMLLMLMFGIVPNEFIRWADVEANWSTERFFYEHARNDYIGDILPFDIHMQAVRDVIVLVLHFIWVPAFFFVKGWQNRGPARSFGPPRTEEPVSDFGRPLVRES